MNTEDFYTGEPVITGSPPIFSQSTILTDEAEAAQNASFGRYNYEPGARQAIYPGGYGYGTMQPQIQPAIGIGAAPQYQYSPYGNIQPTYGAYGGGYGGQIGYNPYGQPQPAYGGYYQPNPVFGYGYQPQYQQPQQPTTYHIPGVGFSGEYMPPADYEARISQLENEYLMSQMEVQAKADVDRRNSVYGYGNGGYGYNYYGMSYYNPYQYNSLNNELQGKVQAMKDEARQNRMDFYMNLSRLAHNFSRDGISDEAIRERYVGRTVDIPQAVLPNQQDLYEQQRLANMVPFDNSQAYRDHFMAVSREFSEVISPDSNLKDTFANMGIIQAKWDMEEEMHRRKDGSTLYDSGNAYKHYIRKKKQERYATEKGVMMMPGTSIGSFNPQEARQAFVNASPTLSRSATLSPDGTLNVSINLPCNVGSHAGESYTVVNSQEAEYDEKRERFSRFIDSIPGSIYLDSQKQKKLEGYNNG